MPRFFIDNISESSAVITGEDARHITRSLRCKVGEELTVCNGKGTDFNCRIVAFDDNNVRLEVLETKATAAEPPVEITLYQALPKGDKLELIVQKAVELGVARIVTVLTQRCVSRPDQKTMEKKLERLSRISLEAAKQSGRGIIPRVEGLLTLGEAVAEIAKADCPIIFYENATQPLSEVLAEGCSTISVLIGCEGGFSEAEVEQAQTAGLAVCSMGSRILRCETAPLYALSAITYEYEQKKR